MCIFRVDSSIVLFYVAESEREWNIRSAELVLDLRIRSLINKSFDEIRFPCSHNSALVRLARQNYELRQSIYQNELEALKRYDTLSIRPNH